MRGPLLLQLCCIELLRSASTSTYGRPLQRARSHGAHAMAEARRQHVRMRMTTPCWVKHVPNPSGCPARPIRGLVGLHTIAAGQRRTVGARGVHAVAACRPWHRPLTS